MLVFAPSLALGACSSSKGTAADGGVGSGGSGGHSSGGGNGGIGGSTGNGSGASGAGGPDGSTATGSGGGAGILTGATAISVGHNHTCAVTMGGGVRCWGDNFAGEIGNGASSSTPVTTAVAVSGLTGVAAVSASTEGNFTCALMAGGTVQCWGDNTHGEIGNGSVSSVPVVTPVAVIGLTGVAAVSTGGFNACAILTDGSVRCWGSWGLLNFTGTNNTDAPSPVTVPGLSGANAISLGDGFACAVVTGGTVQCWGDNGGGQLGNPIQSRTPQAVTDLSGATGISAGGGACALLAGGTVKCWGGNAFGAETLDAGLDYEPITVLGLSGAVAASAGEFHACALTSGGMVECWGSNSGQALGNVSGQSSTPVVVQGLSGATAVSAGDRFSCALLGDSTVKCWGQNDQGQLGNGLSGSSYATPSSVLSGM